MWPFRKKTPPRVLETRRNSHLPAERRWKRFCAAGGVGSALLAAAFFAVVLGMDAWDLEPLPHREGGYLPRNAYARVAFQMPSEEKTQEQRERAAKMAPAVIVPVEPALKRIVSDLKHFPQALKAATQPEDLEESLRKRFGITSPAELAAFARLAEPSQAEEYNQRVDALLGALQERFILSGEDFSGAYYRKDTQQVVVGTGQDQSLVAKSRLLSLQNSPQLNAFLSSVGGGFPAPVAKHVLHYLRQTFAEGTALFELDEQGTEAAASAARKKVGPVMKTIPAGALLAERRVDRGLDRSDWLSLSAEHRVWIRQNQRQEPWRAFWLLLGRGGAIAGVVALMGLYVSKYRPRIVKNHWRGLAVAALLALVLLLGRVTVGAGRLNPYLAVFGIFVGSAVLAIAYDQRFAFAVAGALVVLTTLQLRLGIAPLLLFWAAAATAVFQLREVRTRSKLIEAGGVTAAVLFVAAWAVETAEGVPARFSLVDGGYAAAAAITGGFVAQGVLPLVERIFNVATSLTLLEWCDANKPLLKRLALEAPGTYTHSLMLGSMCEAAAEAIGARGLVARVGAYYHDAGKANKPSYFAENQTGPGSKHDRLSPAMSLLVIKGHVKDGLELAKEYGLPRVLHEFITSHHGTTLVEYFYHAAAEQRKEDVERAPDEVEFRYPGPKPRSREAAILMLADAAESAVRAMPEPIPGRIETQVHQVVSKRLTDGQLDDCELRLQEVHVIEDSLVKSLVGMYHGRVQYPSQKKEGPPEEEKPNSRANGKAAPVTGGAAGR